jgi:basic amino acid/polyamine antiporter, APA family
MTDITNTSFQRSLGLLDATMIVAGSMIGSGIFIVSADIVRNVGSVGWLLVVWIVTGLMTVAAAMSYGELSAMFPRAGGQYVYLREGYNKLIAFLFGWAFFAVIQTGTIAAVGVAFAKFAAYLLPGLSDQNVLWQMGAFKLNAAQLVSIALIVLLTWVNSRGINYGKLIQTTFTLTKLLSLAALIVFGLLLGAKAQIWDANWATAWNSAPRNSNSIGFAPGIGISGVALLSAIAVSMVGSLFSSDAWNNVTFIAGEVNNPKRNIGLSLFLGTSLVSLLYIVTNVMYTAVMPVEAIATAPFDRVAVVASDLIFGNIGTIVIAVMIMISTFGCVNGLILSGARVYHTMAQDGVFFAKAGTLNRNSVPGYALWIQCAWASALCLTGKYGDLLDYVIFVVLIFYILTIIAIFLLRRSRPDAERPYRAFGYPVIPALYVLCAAAICVALLIYKPAFTWPGLFIVLIGIPIYYVMVARNRSAIT